MMTIAKIYKFFQLFEYDIQILKLQNVYTYPAKLLFIWKWTTENNDYLLFATKTTTSSHLPWAAEPIV